jgi:urease accessory protein UreF
MMNLQESHIQALRDLIQKSPALRDQLKQSNSTGDSAKALAEAARQNGLPVDDVALLEYLNNEMQNVAQPFIKAEIADAQLEGVAGGSAYSSRLRLEPEGF